MQAVAIALLISISHLGGQRAESVFTVVPEKPHAGDTLVLTYSPKAKSAALSGVDGVYAQITIRQADHGAKVKVVELQPNGDAMTARVPIPSNAARVYVAFVSRRFCKREEAAQLMVYGLGDKPVRGALEDTSPEGELALYPDNLHAYRTKWFLLGGPRTELYADVIKSDLRRLEGLLTNSPDRLAALSYGYMVTGEESKARACLKQLAREAPNAAITCNALRDYSVLAFDKGYKGPGVAEIHDLMKAYMQRNPTDENVRDEFRLAAFCAGGFKPGDIAIADMDKAMRAWMADAPTHPFPYLVLSRACLNENVNLDEAEEFAIKGATLMLEGYLRPNFDRFGQIEAWMLPDFYETLARIQLANQKTAEALASTEAYKNFDIAVTADSPALEGRIWQSVGNLAKAEAAYSESYRRNPGVAEKNLKEVYAKRRGSLDGFEVFTAKLSNPSVATVSARPAGAAFSVTAINGKRYDLAALKGKVVVLNFWFIGCAPCYVEMPALNKLMAEFKGKDVVFIGFALDKVDAIKKFVQDHRFDYEIVPESARVGALYGVTAFPTNIILDKEGRIVARHTGGSDSIDSQLRAQIQQALNGG